jgi:hypothetical protein
MDETPTQRALGSLIGRNAAATDYIINRQTLACQACSNVPAWHSNQTDASDILIQYRYRRYDLYSTVPTSMGIRISPNKNYY